jgi:5-methylcytosine-specific restriction enzyme B
VTVDALAERIATGLPDSAADRESLAQATSAAIEGLFGSRYPQRSRFAPRVALMSPDQGVPFAGLVHEESPTSGVYGGMSLIWFPIPADDAGPATSLLTFVCGTRGLAPDEQILGRPGHSRHLQALRRHLAARGLPSWVKQDPTLLTEPFPRSLLDRYSRFRQVFERYGNYIYAAVQVPGEPQRAREAVAAFLDLYGWERGWSPLTAARDEVEALHDALRAHLFPRTDEAELVALLRERRFVVLQGPPGTGKTRLANRILQDAFGGRGTTVQFHPAVTYETFVAGIAPAVDGGALRFESRPGWLAQAASKARTDDFLLVVDEINRGDLGRVLGEAIYLFEPREIRAGERRSVTLPHPLQDGTAELEMPAGLHLLGTMNSADRSIAILDLAVRRRFAFVDVWPQLEVVAAQGLPLATDAFARLQDIFAQYAPADALVLLPGHAYFLADDDRELSRRLRYELVPLLREYLLEGRLGPCESELRAYIDWLEGELGDGGSPEA